MAAVDDMLEGYRKLIVDAVNYQHGEGKGVPALAPAVHYYNLRSQVSSWLSAQGRELDHKIYCLLAVDKDRPEDYQKAQKELDSSLAALKYMIGVYKAVVLLRQAHYKRQDKKLRVNSKIMAELGKAVWAID
jgi:hypothetical protein